MRDVSQRKSAEDLLKRSEERTRLAVEEGRIGLFEHDHDAGTSFWSPTYRDLFGIDPDQIADPAAYLGSVHPEDRKMVEVAISKALAVDGWRRVQRRPPDCLAGRQHPLGQRQLSHPFRQH
ncbi:MAG: PAS domain-containing protein [Verrucomicrobiae bacterium]|nr:PAS domain-containing protein [Verrucomicrobiae bacterium]